MNECALCKKELSSVLFTNQPGNYEDFDAGKMLKDSRLGIFFISEEIKNITMNLLRFNCPNKGCEVISGGGWKDLKNHCKMAHKMNFCEVCVTHKKAFTHEHILFTYEALKRHNKEGDPDDPSFKGHPECVFW